MLHTIVDRVIGAISKHVASEYTLPSGGIRIRIDEPPDLWIVISGLQIVHLQLGVVVIAAVPQGVEICHGTSGGNNVAIRIILIAGNDTSIRVHQIQHIALKVGDIVVDRVSSLQCVGIPAGIIEEVQSVAVRGAVSIINNHIFAQKLSTGVIIVMGGIAYSLGSTQAISVVAIGNISRAVSSGRKAPAILPSESPTSTVVVAERIGSCHPAMP